MLKSQLKLVPVKSYLVTHFIQFFKSRTLEYVTYTTSVTIIVEENWELRPSAGC